MTSERNKRVEDEESTNRRAWRWQQRPSEQARGRDRCPYKVKEGSREDGGVWSSCLGKRRRDLNDLSWESKWGSTPNKIIQPTPSTHSLQERKESYPNSRRSKLSSWIWRTCSPNLQGAWLQKAIEQETQNPNAKSRLVPQPVSPKFGLSWEESGTNNVVGPKTWAASERSSSRHTLSERK